MGLVEAAIGLSGSLDRWALAAVVVVAEGDDPSGRWVEREREASEALRAYEGAVEQLAEPVPPELEEWIDVLEVRLEGFSSLRALVESESNSPLARLMPFLATSGDALRLAAVAADASGDQDAVAAVELARVGHARSSQLVLGALAIDEGGFVRWGPIERGILGEVTPCTDPPASDDECEMALEMLRAESDAATAWAKFETAAEDSLREDATAMVLPSEPGVKALIESAESGAPLPIDITFGPWIESAESSVLAFQDLQESAVRSIESS